MTITPENRVPGRSFLLRKIFSGAVVALLTLAVLLFLPAGRLDWIEAWAYMAAYLVFLIVFVAWVIKNDPDLLEERSRVGSNARGWDRIILGVSMVLLLSTLILDGLDGGRFHRSSASVFLIGLGWLGLVLAAILIFWVVKTNTFASRFARIQEDREQRVISTGPYHFVRHPMYAGMIVLFLCTSLALGSLWGLFPAALAGVLFFIRTGLEDRMLRKELAGYEDYVRQVRYRLIPGVW